MKLIEERIQVCEFERVLLVLLTSIYSVEKSHIK